MPKNEAIPKISERKRPKEVSVAPVALEDETLLDELSPKMEDSSIMTMHNSMLSPLCNQIKLRPKAQDNHKKVLEDLSLKSR